MSDEETKDEKELDLSSADVVTKYKNAAEIANSKSSWPPPLVDPFDFVLLASSFMENWLLRVFGPWMSAFGSGWISRVFCVWTSMKWFTERVSKC